MTAFSLHSGGKRGLKRTGRPTFREREVLVAGEEVLCPGEAPGSSQADVLAAGWHPSYALATPTRQAEMDQGNKN